MSLHRGRVQIWLFFTIFVQLVNTKIVKTYSYVIEIILYMQENSRNKNKTKK